MATNGFEFVGYIDGRPNGPRILDFDMAADTAGYYKGDLLVTDSAGRMDKVAGTCQEVAAVCMETETDAVSADDKLKVAIIAKGQIWRCSADASSVTAYEGYTKTICNLDENTIDADGSGHFILWKVDTTEDTSYATVYLCFGDTTWENE